MPAVAVSPVGAAGGAEAIGSAVTATVEVAVWVGEALSVTVSVAV